MANTASMLVSLHESIGLLTLKCQRNVATGMHTGDDATLIRHSPTGICSSKSRPWEDKTQGTARSWYTGLLETNGNSYKEGSHRIA